MNSRARRRVWSALAAAAAVLLWSAADASPPIGKDDRGGDARGADPRRRDDRPAEPAVGPAAGTGGVVSKTSPGKPDQDVLVMKAGGKFVGKVVEGPPGYYRVIFNKKGDSSKPFPADQIAEIIWAAKPMVPPPPATKDEQPPDPVGPMTSSTATLDGSAPSMSTPGPIGPTGLTGPTASTTGTPIKLTPTAPLAPSVGVGLSAESRLLVRWVGLAVMFAGLFIALAAAWVVPGQ